MTAKQPKPLRTWRPMAAWTAGVALCAALASCGAGTALDADNWPRGASEKPAARDLTGTWKISPESISLVRTKGGYPEFVTTISANEDGSMNFRQMPDCTGADGFSANKKAFIDGTGSWMLSESQGCWVISVTHKAGSETFELGLWNRNAPYRLWLAVGDLDAGDYLFFDREPKQ